MEQGVEDHLERTTEQGDGKRVFFYQYLVRNEDQRAEQQQVEQGIETGAGRGMHIEEDAEVECNSQCHRTAMCEDGIEEYQEQEVDTMEVGEPESETGLAHQGVDHGGLDSQEQVGEDGETEEITNHGVGPPREGGR